MQPERLLAREMNALKHIVKVVGKTKQAEQREGYVCWASMHCGICEENPKVFEIFEVKSVRINFQ